VFEINDFDKYKNFSITIVDDFLRYNTDDFEIIPLRIKIKPKTQDFKILSF